MPDAAPAWSLTSAEALKQFQSSARGLGAAEARRRRQDAGPNEISREAARPGWRIFADQFASPLVLILIGASIMSFALGERTETVIILLMVFLGGTLGFVQEYRSELSLRMLRKKLSRRATVLRDGVPHRIDAQDLVPGDIVELELGSVVPADVRLLTVQDLEIDESTLTGESVPVAKTTDALLSADRRVATNRAPQEQSNMAFLGTHAVQGSGTGLVVAIGRDTEMGRTAALLTERVDETSFQKGVRSFGNFLLKMTIVMALVVAVILGALRGQWAESVLFALALAVGISPELLPVIVTLNLTRGALAMSKKHVLVKRLIAIEDLGDADVICTDKTGTLTVGELRVRGSVDPDGADEPSALALAAHCLDIGRNGKATNPTDEAILAATKDETPDARRTTHDSRLTLIDLISFDFTRRRMSCVINNGDGLRWLIAKGATTEVLNACTSRATKSGELTRPLTAKDRTELLDYADRSAQNGIRLIAVARRHIGEQARYSPSDERDLELVGFILVSDAPKETAKEALDALRRLNVRVVILTGDDPHVTRYVAKQLDFAITGLLTGDDLERLNDPELLAAVETTNVFARITPTHKLRILRALKTAGHRVGFIGDGVNDAPALRAADVGISFDSAVDVAKEAAGVILLKKNLSVLADGIKEGRKTFVNTRTYIRTTISSNFGNMLSVAGSALLLPFIPLLPAQILLLNLLGDIPMLGIASDRVSDEDIAYPKKWDVRQISNFMYFFGSISSLADYATFAILLFVAHANISLFRSGWFVESILTEVIIIFFLRSRRTSSANLPALALVGTAAVAITAAIAIVQTPLGAALQFVPIDGRLIGSILLIVAAYAALVEIGKASYYRLWERVPERP